MAPIIAGWVRTPFHRAHKGKLVNMRPESMVASCIMQIISRLNINSEDIDDVIVGCAYPEGEQGYNIGRMAALLSKLPETVPGMTINRLCGSSMQAAISAANAISVGQGECYVVAGVESMSRVKRRGFNWSPHPALESGATDAYISMGITAENVAREYGITREQQEEFAFQSHMKAAANETSSRHIIGVSDQDGEEILVDGCIRASTSIESMARLPPAFDENGTVTAATSSPLTDGAVAMIVCSEEYAQRRNMPSMAKIVAGVVTGVHPNMMGIGPISAGRKLSDRTGWKLSDVDLFEVNEAFSSQSIATISELGLDAERVNIHGGAIAIGHPLGASGARIVGQAASLLESTAGSRAMALMCIGGGMGIGVAIERL
ncbi:MAG: acetyl-CoA C-acyltransferase [Euryarchaeota archaeon]|nr:acetyl-CoA C-acyltransferase [Euryarchaeota archaeon]